MPGFSYGSENYLECEKNEKIALQKNLEKVTYCYCLITSHIIKRKVGISRHKSTIILKGCVHFSFVIILE